MTKPVESTAQDRFVAYHGSHDRGLRDELILEHLGLAHALARRYSGRGEALDDLQQVATVGLLKAVERFDPERGLAFTTFAVPTITGEIKRHFRDRAWATRVPRGLQERALRLTRAVQDLSHELGRSPSLDEIAQALDVDVEAVLEAMEVNRSYATSSLDAPVGNDETSRGLDRVLGRIDPGLEAVDREMVVGDLLASLPERDRQIVHLRFFEGLTQSEISDRIGISQMHVSRLLSKSLASLRELLSEP
jgi:RNA polymerase sigma factor, sigma-70 family/RNA polymerase sigma-70 factor, sigma-B/F/G subfamily